MTWKRLSDIGVFIRGRRFTKADYAVDGIPCIHYGDIYMTYGISARSTVTRLRDDIAHQLRFARTGDVVIAAVGETVADVGKAVAWLGDEPVAIHDDTFLFRGDLDPKFVSYYLQSRQFNEQKDRHVSRAKVKRLSSAGLGQIAVPMPSNQEQKAVVAALDAFDALVNDLSVGLPAELAARRKQYEHYRDRLLTFKELAA